MSRKDWVEAASIGAFVGLLVGGVLTPIMGPSAAIVGPVSAAGVFVLLAVVFRLWGRPTIAVPRPRKPDPGSPRIDSFNLAANQYFLASQPPPELRGFIDRQTENHRDALRAVANRLRDNDRVVVHGEGGVGKSVIAYQAAARVARREKLDFYWISANGRDGFDHGALIGDLAGFIGCEETQATVCEHLREHPSLLVFDNLETVRDPSVAVFLKGYLPQQCRLAVTTRQFDPAIQAWGVPVRLEPMDERRALEYVRSQTADDTISGNLTEGIASVSQGIPEVMRQLVAYQRAGVLQDALNEFREGSGNIAERIFGRSFERLSVEAKTALCVLSLLPSADLDFMRHRTANIDVSGALRELGEWSLVYRDESGFNWWLSGLTRSFAETRILEVLGYWRDTARQDGKWDEAAARVLIALTSWPSLFNFLHLRGYWRECIAHWEPAAEAARSVGPKPSLMSIVGNLANMYQLTGDIDRAERGLQEAFDIAAEAGSERNMAVGLHQLGILAQGQGRVEEAAKLYRRSLEINERIGDQQGIAKGLHNLGALAQDQGRVDEAEGLYRRSLEIKERIGDQEGIASSLHQLGILAQDRGRTEEPEGLYRRSLEIKERIGDQQGIAKGLHQLGMLAQTEEAVDLYSRSLEIKEHGDQQGIAISMHQLGMVAQHRDRIEEARVWYSRSLQIKERIGDQQGMAATFGQLGLLAGKQGDLGSAERRLADAFRILESLGSPMAEQAQTYLEEVRSKLSESAAPRPDSGEQKE